MSFGIDGPNTSRSRMPTRKRRSELRFCRASDIARFTVHATPLRTLQNREKAQYAHLLQYSSPHHPSHSLQLWLSSHLLLLSSAAALVEAALVVLLIEADPLGMLVETRRLLTSSLKDSHAERRSRCVKRILGRVNCFARKNISWSQTS